MRAALFLLAVVLAGSVLAQGYAPSGSAGLTRTQVSRLIADAGVVTSADDVQAVTLGEELSLRTLTLTQADSTLDTLVILNGRLRLAPANSNSGAYIQYVPEAGFYFGGGGAVYNCAGCFLATDSLYSRQNDRPVSVDQSHGLRITPQASLGECGTTAEPPGTIKNLSATASSATRTCKCILTSSTGDYRWFNMDNHTRGSTTTDCPDTTP